MNNQTTRHKVIIGVMLTHACAMSPSTPANDAINEDDEEADRT
jgi:hypothetical protein